ncbi:kinase-like domain-containing protein [Powellomyces hirtus]|nr:kinase-like domain-containing protein [Powellomyces hirtus]
MAQTTRILDGLKGDEDVSKYPELKMNRGNGHQRRLSENWDAGQKQPHSYQNQIGNYDYVRTIGEGSFAKVKLAIHRLTDEKVAIKVIDKDALPDTYSLTHLHREAQIMRMLDHPNIVQLIEVMETKRQLHLVLEYASGGEVLDYIVAHQRLKESEARKFFHEVVSALKYCHERNIVHRDLKAENLLLDSEMHIKISDFGLSNIFDRGKQLSTCCGSPVYSAPELIEGRKYVGPEVDSWSLGVNLYAMVVGDLPFAEKELKKLYERILSGRYHVPSYVSPECKDLISKLLVLDPAKRYTSAQVLEHPWMLPMSPSRSLAWEDNIAAATDPLSRNNVRPQKIPELDLEILQYMETLNYAPDVARQDILSGKFNQAAGTYYLLALKKRKVALAKKQNGPHTNPNEPDATKSKQEKSARAAEDLTSDELAIVLIKAERTRVNNRMQEEMQGAAPRPAKTKKDATGAGHDRDESVGARGHPKTRNNRSSVNADNNANHFKVPRDSKHHVSGDNVETLPNPHPPVIRTRRHSFSPGEVVLQPPPLARNQSNQGFEARNGVPKPAELGHTRSTSQEAPATAKVLTRHSLRSGAIPAATTLPPIPTDTTHMAAQLTAKQGLNKTSKPSSSAALPAPVPTSSNLRSHRPRSNTIQIDESLYISSAGVEPRTPYDDLEPRTIRFAFNCHTTTGLPYNTVFGRLIDTLNSSNIDYVAEGFLCVCEAGDIRFEAEICKLPRLLMYGIRLKRISGDMWEYKKICQKIMEGLQL